MFSPPVPTLPRPLSQYSLETPTFAQHAFTRELSPTPPPSVEQAQVCHTHPIPHQVAHQTKQPERHQRIIPLEEDMRRLFQECKIARGNALLLSEALAFAKPEALDAGLIPVRLLPVSVRPYLSADLCRSSLQNVVDHEI